jgi:phosphoribosylglycinamide formyltransferase 1
VIADRAPMRIAILLSGRGSNFEAIHEAIQSNRLDATIAIVISNRPDARGIARAKELGYVAHAVDHKEFASRAAHEEAVLKLLAGANVQYVVLAGYMRLLSAAFVAAWRNRIINIHPSLLPSFPGVDAQGQAVAHGVKISGCTVHLVDEHLDAGPIIAQRSVAVLDDDTAETLSARILHEEHQAYIDALQKMSGGFEVDGRRVKFRTED